MSRSIDQKRLLVALWRQFILFARWHAAEWIGLILLVAVLEGAGLMLLSPMLELIGVGGSAPATTKTHFASAFSALGMEPSLKSMLLIYLGMIVVHSLLSWHLSGLGTRLEAGFIDQLRQDLFDDIGATEWSFLANIHSAEFSHALTVDIARIQSGIYSSVGLVTTAIITLGYVATAIYLSPTLTCVTLGVGFAFLMFLRKRHRNSFALGHGLTESTQRVHQDIGEYFSGLKLAKSGNVEARLSARFAEGLQWARGYAIEFARKHAASQGLFRVGGAAVLCAFVYLALVVLTIPVAKVMALAFIFMRLFPSFSQMQQGYEEILNTLPAYQAYTGMIERCRSAFEPRSEGKPYQFDHEIFFSKVSYRPGNTDAEIVSDLTLSIPARSTTALVGASGAGKSTVADLLAGLLAPSAGSISVDGRALDDRRAWRQGVAYVPQETFLFNSSIRENLLWTMSAATDAELWNALEQAAAADFVRAMPSGLDTVLGERGIRLSGGERQRLAIARALLRKPQLLVLDEATSALDHDNERHIQEMLSRLHQQLTILLIAHRPATILCADRVVSMQHGRLLKVDIRADGDLA